ncbi:MAG: restriction endonuclease subunit S [Segetibacter sp.]
MKHNWKIVKVENVLSQYKEYIEIPEPLEYKKISVKLYGKGAVLDSFVDGANLKMRRHQLAKSGQVILSEIWGKKGAIGIVPEEGEGALCTSHFFLFDILNEVIEPKYFHFILLSNILERQLFEVAQGTTGYAATRPKDFLNTLIPLPPVPEQQRIVSKIESVKQKREEIQQLRSEQEREINFLRNIIFIDLQNEFDNIPIGNILIPHYEMVELNPDENYKQVTVRMEHKGVLLRGMMNGTEIGSKQYSASKGDFIISKIDARNGAMGIIPAELDGAIVTNDFPLYSSSEEVNPKYFYYFSNTFYFDDACKKASEGTTNRRRLKIDKFENILMPLPPIEEQNRIVSLLDKLNEVKTNHIQTEKELTQLLPSLLDKTFKGEL